MNKLLPVYLLLGPEEGEKTTFINSLTDEIRKKSKADIEIHRFYSFETGIKEVIALLRNGSLFSDSILVMYHGCEELQKKDDLVILSEYLKAPARGTALLLISSFIKMNPKFDTLIPKEGKKIFWELFENQKRGFVLNFVKQKGFSLSRDGVELLLELVENNTRDLQIECEKLCNLFEPGKEITAEDLETYMFHSREESVFTLFEKIAYADFEGAEEILNKLLLARDNQPVQILAGLLWQFKNLIKVKRLLDRQFSPKEAHAQCKIRSKKNQKIYTAAGNNYSLDDLKRIVLLTADFDTALRTVKTDIHGLLLSLFLYYCIRKKGVLPDKLQSDFNRSPALVF